MQFYRNTPFWNQEKKKNRERESAGVQKEERMRVESSKKKTERERVLKDRKSVV